MRRGSEEAKSSLCTVKEEVMKLRRTVDDGKGTNMQADIWRAVDEVKHLSFFDKNTEEFTSENWQKI